MSVIFRLRGDEEMSRYIRDFPDALQGFIRLRFSQLASAISARIKEKLSGEVLNIQTGRLRASIFAATYYSKNHVSVSIGSRGDVPYAAIQEYGGDVFIPKSGDFILPKNKAALSIYGQCKAYARAHSIHIPESSYIRSTISEMEPDFQAGLVEALDDAVKQLK